MSSVAGESVREGLQVRSVSSVYPSIAAAPFARVRGEFSDLWCQWVVGANNYQRSLISAGAEFTQAVDRDQIEFSVLSSQRQINPFIYHLVAVLCAGPGPCLFPNGSSIGNLFALPRGFRGVEFNFQG